MQPRLFRQRLLELSAEYEGLHAAAARAGRGSGSALAEVPDAPAEGGPAASPDGDGESAQPSGGSLLQLTRASVTWDSMVSHSSDGGTSSPSGDTVAPLPEASAMQVKVSRRSRESADTSRLSVTSEEPRRASRTSAGGRFVRNPGKKWTGNASLVGKRSFEASVSTSIRSSTRLPLGRKNGPLASFVKSRFFAVASAFLIIMNTLLVGIETQVLSILSQQRSGSDQLLGVLSVANYVLTFMFAVEVVMRVLVLGLHNPKDRMWNVFDMIILVLALVEIALDIAVQILSGRGRNPFDHGGMAKMLRLFRLTRLLRIVRTVRQLKPLRVLVHSIASASKSVFWALMLLVMIVYAFGVILTQAATEHTEGGARVDDEDLVSYYGDLYLSMLSLWMAVSGGINWNQLTAPLEGTGNATWMMFFLVYITFVYFFVLNVVTGVFCQNAIEGAQQDLDLTIEAQLKEKQVYAERLRMLFDEMNEDYDADEELTAAVIQEQMAKPKVQSWFNALDIDTKQTWKLFKAIDADGSGRVSVQEFIEGCLQMRGSATRVDVESLKWEIRSANSNAQDAAERMLRLLGSIQASGAARGPAR